MKHNIITERLGDGVTRLVIDVTHKADEAVLRTWEQGAHTAFDAVRKYAAEVSEEDLSEIEDEIMEMREHGPSLTSMLTIGGLALPHVDMTEPEIVEHLARKQRDYGPGNILAFGDVGLMVRMSDKTARLRNLLSRENTAAVAEPLEDAWLDLVGYAVIGQMLADNTFLLPLAEFSLPWTDAEFKQFLTDAGTALVEAVS